MKKFDWLDYVRLQILESYIDKMRDLKAEILFDDHLLTGVNDVADEYHVLNAIAQLEMAAYSLRLAQGKEEK